MERKHSSSSFTTARQQHRALGVSVEDGFHRSTAPSITLGPLYSSAYELDSPTYVRTYDCGSATRSLAWRRRLPSKKITAAPLQATSMQWN
eukprot:scaffold576_cov260-Pinguiococcus_pyrenoidosus.AAC.69